MHEDLGLKSYEDPSDELSSSGSRPTGIGWTVLVLVFFLSTMALSTLAPLREARAEGHEFGGYINSTALNVRSGPGTQSDVIGILLKYDPVTVTGARNVGSTNWYSIKASGGYTNGWVSAQFVVRGDPPAAASEGQVDYGEQETPTVMKGAFQYVGTKACQECHEDAVGDFPNGAFGVWKEHFHSAAFQTLKRDYTLQIAKRARGIDDPTTDWRCVKCHVTALGAAPSQIGPDYTQEEGVGCEVCHGPGGSYAEEDHGPDVANREAMGFRVLRNLDDRREVCTSCHNTASPTYKPFDLRQFSRKIAHWVDDDDNAYRAEAVRESERRAESVSAAGTTATATATTAAATAASAAAATQARATTESEAASRAAQARAEAEASRRAEDARATADAASEAVAATEADAKAKAAQQAEAAAQAKAEADRRAEAASAAAAAGTEAAAEEKRMAEEKARAAAAELERERAEKEASAAAAAAKAKEQAAQAAAPPAASVNPLAEYLEDVDDVIVLNEGGVKYQSMEFPHLAHAGDDYLPGGDCQTCHHTQEGTDTPEACSECHDIGGDAEEEKAKKRFAHAKTKGFPKEPDQEEVSCVGCHKSMNAMLAAGEREGDKAPTKCTVCHEKQ
jgi:hypothetical protein